MNFSPKEGPIMKRNLLLLVCIIALAVSCLASCGDITGTGSGGKDDCEHTFSDEWYNDANNHWHPATCEHGEQNSGLAPHSDEDEDGICDVCEYEVGHTHSFAEEWSTSETHHWHVATCSHSEEQSEYGLHADEDLDGKCDLCSIHVHDVNAAGYCKHSDCGLKVGEVDENGLENLVNAFLAQAGLVNGGQIKYEVNSPSNESPEYAAWSEKVVDFEFGKDFAHYNAWSHNIAYSHDPVELEDTLETWYQADGAGTFGVSSSNGEPIVLISSDPNKLIGYYYTISSLADGDGAETFLFNLYEASQAGSASDFTFTADPDNNSASFAFNSLIVQTSNIAVGENIGSLVYNVNYFEVEISFSYTDDMVLTGLDITLDRYTNDAGGLFSGAQNLADIDIKYDPETGEFKFVSYNKETEKFEDAESAPADTYTYSITQTVGERTAETPYPKEKFIPESFDIYLNYNEETGVLSNKHTGATLNANVSDLIKFFVGDCTPADTSLHFVADLISIKLYKDGVEVENATDYDNTTAVAMPTFAGEQRSFFLIPKVDGAYTLEIWLDGNKIHKIDINVGIVDEDKIQLEDNQFIAKVTEAHEWANEVVFTAEETGTYYFNLPAGVGFMDADGYDAAEKTPATDDTPNPYFDYHNATNPDGSFNPGSFSIELEAGQSIRFYVNATKKGTFIIEFFCI